MKSWLDFGDWLGRWLFICSEKVRTRRFYSAQHKRWDSRKIERLKEGRK